MTPYARAVAFFAEHAGYSHDPKTETLRQGRMRGARALAKAEAAASAYGFTYEWRGEDVPDLTHPDPDERKKPHTVLCVRLVDPNRDYIFASLGNIIDPDSLYERVVQAELAEEALAQLRCGNCARDKDDHGDDGKCLFEPTYFETEKP